MVFRTVARSSSGVGAFASSSCHPCGRRWLPCGGCPATRCGTQFLPKIYKRCCIFAWSTCLLDDVHDTDAEAPALQHLIMYQNSSTNISQLHFCYTLYITRYKLYVYIYISIYMLKIESCSFRKTRKSNFPWTWRSRSSVSSMTLRENFYRALLQRFYRVNESKEQSMNQWTFSQRVICCFHMEISRVRLLKKMSFLLFLNLPRRAQVSGCHISPSQQECLKRCHKHFVCDLFFID